MEQATTDHIMDININHTQKQRILIYGVIKVGQILHHGKWLTSDKVQQKFPHLREEPKEMGTISSEGERIDLGGYWWPPNYSTWTPTIFSFIFLFSLIIAQFTIFISFSGPELPEPF